MKKIFNRTSLSTIILMSITAVAITISTALCTTKYLLVIPLYVSLFISFLQTRLIRYAYLIGGINSILYFVVYMYSGIPATAFYALLFSFPLQIITFIRWTKNKRGTSTLLRRMTRRQQIWVALSFVAVWMVVFFMSRLMNSNFAILDTTSSMLGILTTFLTIFAFVEYTVLQIISGVANLSLYINIVSSGRGEQVPFLVYSVYSLICIFMAAVHAKRLYEKQCEEAKKEHTPTE